MDTAAGLKKLKSEEKKILQEAEKIEEAERKIDEEEGRILASEKVVLRSLKNNPFRTLSIDDGLTRREFKFLRLFFAHRAAKYKLLFATLGTVGVVLVWRGVWHTADELPIIKYSLASLGVGLFLLWLLKRYTNIR